MFNGLFCGDLLVSRVALVCGFVVGLMCLLGSLVVICGWFCFGICLLVVDDFICFLMLFADFAFTLVV